MKELTFAKDYVVEVSCPECGWIEENKRDLEDLHCCEECGNEDIVYRTANEDEECICCGKCIDNYEDVWLTEDDEVVCEDCYRNGEYEEQFGEVE